MKQTHQIYNLRFTIYNLPVYCRLFHIVFGSVGGIGGSYETNPSDSQFTPIAIGTPN